MEGEGCMCTDLEEGEERRKGGDMEVVVLLMLLWRVIMGGSGYDVRQRRKGRSLEV